MKLVMSIVYVAVLGVLAHYIGESLPRGRFSEGGFLYLSGENALHPQTHSAKRRTGGYRCLSAAFARARLCGRRTHKTIIPVSYSRNRGVPLCGTRLWRLCRLKCCPAP